MNSYKLWKRIMEERTGDDIDWLKADIKETVTDRLENYVTQWWYEDELYAAEENDNTDSNWVWSSIEDACWDWLDDNLFREE